MGLDPVPLLKIGTRLLASLGSKGKNRNSLACPRNAGSYSAEFYSKVDENGVGTSRVTTALADSAEFVRENRVREIFHS